MVVIALKTVLWRMLLWCIGCAIVFAVTYIAGFVTGDPRVRNIDVKGELRTFLIYGIGGGLVVSIISTAVWM